MKTDKLYINGEWIDPATDKIIEVENPTTGEIIGNVPASSVEDVNKAVEGAKKAFTEWKEMGVEKRAEYVEKLLDYIKSNEEKISKTIHEELGTPPDTAKKTHIQGYYEFMEDAIAQAKKYKFVEEFDGYEVHKDPVGVVGALTPWNYPLGQIVKKVIPALLMGNTVVLKPSKGTPITAYHFADAVDAAVFPPGVFQLVPGKGSEVGNLLATHKDVDMISFTGSTSGGKEVSKLAADSVKRVSLELGGKSAAIFLEGTDYEDGIRGVLNTVYLNVGQNCSAKTRLLAPKSDKEKLEKLLIDISKEYKFGDPRDEGTQVGPLGSKSQFEKVTKYVDSGKSEATLLYQGETTEGEGHFFPPTIFTDVTNELKIAQEEIFGPVLSIIYYDTVEEAIEIANDSIYGLSGMVFGPVEEAKKVALKLRTGQVQINNKPGTHLAPFGGFKQSGIGREGGIFGLEEYVELKTIFI